MKRIVAACDHYGGNRARIKAFVLTMRYTGLRIGDVWAQTQVVDGKVFVRTAKTGQPVSVPVPPDVVAALGKVENGSDRYFWTGKNIRSAVSNWSRYLGSVFELANIQNGHSHRFRDTCAVELLLAGRFACALTLQPIPFDPYAASRIGFFNFQKKRPQLGGRLRPF
jgi:integrase